MSWISLLDIIYPVGSLYFSTSSISPATLVGGSWTQIKGATIAAVGDNNVAVANYNGSLKISVSQMPRHAHPLIYSGKDNYTTTCSIKVNAFNVASCNDWLKGPLSVITQQEPGSGATFSDGSDGNYTGGARLYALQLWSLYLVSNQLVGGYNG